MGALIQNVSTRGARKIVAVVACVSNTEVLKNGNRINANARGARNLLTGREVCVRFISILPSLNLSHE
jgi:hypothetical protein